ncbi:methionine adenosyltransferase [Microbacterium caowuchunii]|uniref:Methionine adenosyltransferase n=1 Tax=Microbacterium caowuchunii TaxID=2614638 RepID=A0A5N0TFE6_9MICO|nr:methionine adenosyltransferase [Microbacterium caowuchunii]KAA9133750.1 methionine adenosyltransferase [Microbacterium caowuchunii]
MFSGLFSSESVAAGHPDKLCDRISDAVLDAYLTVDPEARVACESAAGPGWVRVFGEVRSSADVDVEDVVRGAIRRAGFTSEADGLDPEGCDVQVVLARQSPEIAAGVDNSLEARAGVAADEFDRLGAGDQGLMFGYACSETPELMPLALMLSHRLTWLLPLIHGAGPDAKAQVTVEYSEGSWDPEVRTVLCSVQHAADVDLHQFKAAVRGAVVSVLDNAGLSSAGVRVLVNPSGSFVLGGPAADAGLTGRKIIVDTYGGAARHGGGAFSGKDSTKVDRSAAYALRHVAKTIVASGLASRAEVQASYAIGVVAPVGLAVETFGTGIVPDAQLAAAVSRVFDLRPAAIIDRFKLRRPIFEATASGGHFGRESFPWERNLPIAALRAALD